VLSFEHGGRREVGYVLGKAFWGQGIATAALRQFIELDTVRPLYAGVALHNVASRRVLEKCGFTPCAALDDTKPDGDGVQWTLLRLDA
jgi:RimJ/RimL family protein N-acetyltransferase